MAPVKVFGSARFTNVARVLVCLEEVGVAYEVVDIDFPTKEHKKPEHLARNPFGVIPAFQDGDLMLFESRAIAKYILRKYRTDEVDMLREGNLQEAAMVDVWTEVEAHQYNQALAPIVMECIIYPTAYGIPTNQKVVDESVDKLKKVLEVYEARLSEHEYLAGNFISSADLSHFPFTCRFMETPYASLFDSFPSVKAWWEKLMLRPSMKKISTNLHPKMV
ncbi:probable glutathione S-transferase GSTF1 [Lolium rigidum]|uniref:probable glutathione S-transferase GSTF1 n=1 Tax=Lolium rigidum TaxID=89674 RepID=UPI001F5D36E6|nr:probable glutathione S-transferase GSTF1 [Lolium rigidum]XP_047069699.1 probable glutathione S-transferase GSTF1 [Lolium rigidum]